MLATALSYLYPVRRAFSSYLFRYCITVVLAVLAFLPLMSRDPTSYLEDTVVAASLQDGHLHYESSIVALTLVVPVALDMFFDVLVFLQHRCTPQPAATKKTASSSSSTSSSSSSEKKDMVELVTQEKCLMLLGFVISPLTAFLPKSMPNFALTWMCCHRAQFVLVVSTAFISWCRLFPRQFTPLFTSTTVLLFGTAQVMFNYYDNYSHMASPPPWVTQVDTAAVIMYFPIMLIMLFNAGVLLVRTAWAMLRSAPKQKEVFATSRITSSQGSGKDKGKGEAAAAAAAGSGHDHDHLFFPFVYVLSCFVALVIIFVVISLSKEWALQTPLNLFTNNCAYIIMELCILNFFLRRVKFEAVTALTLLLQSKKHYVRYISHELRTPLNSAFLGLKVVLDDLRDSEDEEEREMYETLHDVHQSCVTAVEILNDLMCYDKIESGILELHKEAVPVLDFLQEAFFSFRAEAQERNVDLEFVAGDRSVSTHKKEVQQGSRKSLLDSFNEIFYTDRRRSSAAAAAALDADTTPAPSRRTSALNGLFSRRASAAPALAMANTAAAAGSERDHRRRSSVHQAPALLLHAALDEADGLGGGARGGAGAAWLPLRADDVVMLDKFKCNQVVRNLVSNALKFSPKKGKVTLNAVFVPTGETTAPGATVATAATDRKRSSFIHGMVNLISRHHSHSKTHLDIDPPAPPVGGGGAGAGSSGGGAAQPLRAAAGPAQQQQHGTGLPTGATTADASPRDTVQGVLRISFTDRGVGISPANQKRLFKEIVQFNPDKLQAGGGSGFGLFITKGIVDLHGGDIRVHSEGEGEGCSFTVEFPMTRSATTATATATATVPPLDITTAVNTAGIHAGRNAPAGMAVPPPASTSAVSASLLAAKLEQPGLFDGPPLVTTATTGGASEGRATLRRLSQMPAPAPGPGAGVHVHAGGRLTAAGTDTAGPQFVQIVREEPSGGGGGGGEDGARQPSRRPFSEPDVAPGATKEPGDGHGSGPMVTAVVTAAGVSEPLAPAAPDAGTTAAPADASSKSNKSGKGGKAPQGPVYHVLVVDDSAMSRKMLCKILKKDHHTCEEAEDGAWAVETAQAKLAAGSGFFDAVLMDFVMPNMDGPDATAAIRTLGVTCPIFGVTGNTLDHDVQRFMDSGATDVYGKPFDMARFTRDMRAWTEQQKDKK